jgi:transposase
MKDTAQNQDSTARIRRQYSAGEKVRLLRLHLVEGQPISTICDKHQIHPTLFYQWQKTFFENGAAAFDRSPRPRRMDLGNAKVEQLEARLKKKDEVIAAVTEELVRTKKELGED